MIDKTDVLAVVVDMNPVTLGRIAHEVDADGIEVASILRELQSEGKVNETSPQTYEPASNL